MTKIIEKTLVSCQLSACGPYQDTSANAEIAKFGQASRRLAAERYVLRALAQEARCSSASRSHTTSHPALPAAAVTPIQPRAPSPAPWQYQIAPDLLDQKDEEKPECPSPMKSTCCTSRRVGETVWVLLRQVGHQKQMESAQTTGMHPKPMTNIWGWLIYSQSWIHSTVDFRRFQGKQLSTDIAFSVFIKLIRDSRRSKNASNKNHKAS